MLDGGTAGAHPPDQRRLFYRGWRDVPRNWPTSAAQVMATCGHARHRRSADRVSHRRCRSRPRIVRQDPSLANRLGGYEGDYLGAGAPSPTPPRGPARHRAAAPRSGADPNLPEDRSRREARRSTKRSSTATTRSRSSCSSAVRFRIRRSISRGMRTILRANGGPTRHGAAAPLLRRDADTRGSGRGVAGSRTQLAAHHAAHDAARSGDLQKAKALLDAGANLTARDEHLRSTPLAWAAKFGQHRDGHAAARARGAAQVSRTIRHGRRRSPGRRSAGTRRSPACCSNSALSADLSYGAWQAKLAASF